MIQPDLKELMDNSIKDAEFLLKKTQCRQAFVNLEAVKGMHKMLLIQDKAEDKLLNMCAEAAQRCKDYVAILETAEEYVGPKAWAKIMHKAARKRNCVCEGGDAQ